MRTTRFSIDIKDLKDLKRHLLTMDNAGDRPPRYGGRNGPVIVGRGPVPRHAAHDDAADSYPENLEKSCKSCFRHLNDREGQALALR